MEASLDAAGIALLTILEPHRLMFLFFGVGIGIVIGILPGVSGIAGIALLLPFTYNMDAYTALAFLLGLGSVVTTSDVLMAILFGVPGTASAQATLIEGYPMAKRGEAARALSACYMASMIGGLFGALVLGLMIPILRPIMLYIGSPELLAFALFGISMISALSGSTPLRGLAAAGLGIMFAMVGADPQTGTLRWTMGSLFLWDGLPLLPFALGIFALPELCDLAISRTAVAKEGIKINMREGMIQGAKDVFGRLFLTLRCGGIGAAIGAVPGLGGAVVGWLAYAHALRTEKDAYKTFGKGDVRGLIATESANNAKEGGALIPTIAFGVPGSASMAILLGAFLIHGLVPGPEMLTTHLDVTYAMVWSVALANIIGSMACYAFSGYFAKITTLRYTVLLPVILIIIYVGAYQDSRDWGAFFTLFGFGVLGWTMKHLKWPRPPLILGFVLGEIIERYMFISIGRYDYAWLLHPIVMVVMAMAIFGFVRPFRQNVRMMGGFKKMMTGFGEPRYRWSDTFPTVLIVMLAAMLLQTGDWATGAKIVPLVVGWTTLVVLCVSLANRVFRVPLITPSLADGEDPEEAETERLIHMDIQADHGDLSVREVMRRGGIFAAWLLGIMAMIRIIGFIPTVPLLVIMYMRIEGREKWRLVGLMAVGLTLFVYYIFDRILSVNWPSSIMGEFFSVLQAIPSV